jgi:hypothetical protein
VTLVTLTIGGNDAGFPSLIALCGGVTKVASWDDNLNNFPDCGAAIAAGFPGDAPYHDKFDELINTTVRDNLNTSIAWVHYWAPNARIALVGYPALWPNSPTCPETPDFFLVVHAKHQPYLYWLQSRLNDVQRAVAQTNHITFVDMFTQSAGHDSCQPPAQQWVFPDTPIILFGAPLHPTDQGSQNIAALTIAALNAP